MKSGRMRIWEAKVHTGLCKSHLKSQTSSLGYWKSVNGEGTSQGARLEKQQDQLGRS